MRARHLYPFMLSKHELRQMGLLILLDHCGPILEGILHLKPWSHQDNLTRRKFVEQGFLTHCVEAGQLMWRINPDRVQVLREDTLDMLAGHGLLGGVFRDAVTRILLFYGQEGQDMDDEVAGMIECLVDVYTSAMDRHERARLEGDLRPWAARKAGREAVINLDTVLSQTRKLRANWWEETDEGSEKLTDWLKTWQFLV